jgi:hypothetical protein
MLDTNLSSGEATLGPLTAILLKYSASPHPKNKENYFNGNGLRGGAVD